MYSTRTCAALPLPTCRRRESEEGTRKEKVKHGQEEEKADQTEGEPDSSSEDESNSRFITI